MSAGVVCFMRFGLLDKAVNESRERVRAAFFARSLVLAREIQHRQSRARRCDEGRFAFRFVDCSGVARGHGGFAD